MSHKKTDGQPTVMVEHSPTPDAKDRLRRAYELILRAEAKPSDNSEPAEADDGREVSDDT